MEYANMMSGRIYGFRGPTAQKLTNIYDMDVLVEYSNILPEYDIILIYPIYLYPLCVYIIHYIYTQHYVYK